MNLCMPSQSVQSKWRQRINAHSRHTGVAVFRFGLKKGVFTTVALT